MCMGQARAPASRQQGKLATRTVLPLLAFAQSRGISERALLRGTQLSGVAMPQWGETIAQAEVEATWRNLRSIVDEPALGLQVAEHVRMEHLDLIHFLGRSSGQLRKAMRLFCESFGVLDSHGICLLDVTERLASMQIRSSVADPHFTEFFVATMVRGFQCICARRWHPKTLYFAHAASGPAAPYEEFFRSSVVFAAPMNAFAMDAALLDESTIAPDSALHALLRRQLDSLVERAAPSSLSQQTREVIASQLPGGRMTIDSVAAELGTSRRTLQRRLGDERTSFVELVADLRRGLADLYLRETALGIAEIAARLGYTDPGAFQRAFRGWYGATPGEYRNH